MSAPIRQFSFSAGELSPTLYARTDLDRYANGVRTARNMMVMRQGGLTGRPGTEYISTALNGGNQVRLIPFIFNETGLGQSYVLEFGNQYIAFYQNGGNVISSSKTITGVTKADPAVVTSPTHGFSNGDIITISGILGMTQLDNGYFIVQNVTTNTFTLQDLFGNIIDSTSYGAYTSGGIADKIYKISSPYLQADLQNLYFDQCADIVTITNQNYPAYELSRSGATNWALTRIVFTARIAAPKPLFISGGGSGPTGYVFLVTSVNANGDETNYDDSPGGPTFIGSGSVATASPTNPITISWGLIAGAVYYRIYCLDASGGTLPNHGFVGTSSGPSFAYTGQVPDYSNQIPMNIPFSFPSAGNYPAIVGFCQQRRYFGDTTNNPVAFWGSHPGNFYDYGVHISPDDSDAIIGAIAGSEVNSIQAILELKFMLMLTAGAEIYLQGNGSGVVTPSAINASTQSQYGAASLKPLKVSDVLIFKQALGSAIRDFTFDFAIDGYRGNDITIFSAHLFEGYQIVDWCYQKVPDSIVWAVRSDGVLLSLTYVREQQILAWTRHDFTDGFVENVCAIPENGEYAVYASIKRTINTNVQVVTINQFQIVAGVNDAIDLIISGDGSIHTTFIPASQYTGATLATAVANAINSLGIIWFGSPIVWGCSFTGGFFDIFQNTVLSETFVDYVLLWKTGIHASTSAALCLGWPTVDAPSTNSGPNTNDAHAPNAPGISSYQSYVKETVRSIERISSRLWPDPINIPPVQYDPINASYLDCFTKYDGRMSFGANPLILYQANGQAFDTTSLAYEQPLIIRSSSNYFTPAMVSNQIFIEDEEWVNSQGKEGNQVRCTIQSYLDPTHVSITPDTGIVPVEFRTNIISGPFISLNIWSLAVQTVSGLGFLEGQKVSVWADRFVVGSPLNPQVSTKYVVTNGSITLDKQYAVIYVGLPMTQDVEPLDLESYFGETMLAKRKRISRASVYVYNTRSFFAGGENPDTNQDNINDDPLFELYEEKNGTNQATYDVAPELMTAQDYVITPSRWTKSGRVFFRNVDPVPFSLLAIAPSSEDPVQTPYKRGG